MMKTIKESIIKNVSQDDETVEMVKKISDWVESHLFLDEGEYTIRKDLTIDIHPKKSISLDFGYQETDRSDRDGLPDYITINTISNVPSIEVNFFKTLRGLPEKFDGKVQYNGLHAKTLEGGFREIGGKLVV